MAQLCIRVAANAHPTDPKLTPLRTQPGDVVSVVEDDHQFSKAELNSGQYVIVAVPGTKAADLAYLTQSAFDKNGALALKRTQYIDVPILAQSSIVTADALVTTLPNVQATTIAKAVAVPADEVAL